MTRIFPALLLILSLGSHAQKIEERFDISFKPTKNMARYYVITESRDGHWYREAYYLPEMSLALKASYKDKECTIPDGEEVIFYPNKNLKSTGHYIDGKKDGSWVVLHDNGMMSDSAFYAMGHLSGISYGWNEEGYQVDSSFSDGKGNRVEVHWYPGGNVASAGYIAADTNKIKRWNYYHTNGRIMAIEDYDNKGKRIACECFTETGQRLDSCVEKEAHFPGNDKAWFKYLEGNLHPEIPINKNAPLGTYTTMIQFVVNADGSLSGFKPLTSFGFGMEEEVIRILKASPKWIPAIQFGRPVKAYRKQPVSFRVTQG